MADKNGWHFTKNGKYTVQLGYQIERIYPDKEKPPELYGPHVDILKAFFLESEVSPEAKAFSMVIGVWLYRGNEKSESERDTRRSLLCQVWRFGGINQSCIF